MDIPVVNPVAVNELAVTAQSGVPVADTATEGGESPKKGATFESVIPVNVNVIALEQSNTTA